MRCIEMSQLSLVGLELESKCVQHADQCSESLLLLDQNHKVQRTPHPTLTRPKFLMISLSAWFPLSKAGIQYRTLLRIRYSFCKYCRSAKICTVIKDDKSPVPTGLGQFSVETDFTTGVDISCNEPHAGES